MQYLSKIMKDETPTHFYSSEKYGESVAKYMNIVDRRVDDKREKVPIKATIVRENLEKNKKWLEDIVYSDYKKMTNNNMD